MRTIKGTAKGSCQGNACIGEPVIIPDSDHSIRVQSLDRDALKVLYRLRDAGFTGYLVGGGVRDLYMRKDPKDFDISTDARPGQLRKLFRNSRTIGRRFRLVQVFFRGGKIIEVSTLRSQSEFDITQAEKVLPSNNSFGTLPEDALRRDLTINSLFYEIENRTIIDYVGGVQDLDQGIIRIVGDPDRRVTRDPVRILRAIRHAARAGFSIEPATWKAILGNREKLNLCPPSRIRDELLKDLHGGASAAWFRLAFESGIFHVLFPCYNEVLSSGKNKPHQESLQSLLTVVDRLQNLSSHEVRIVIPDYILLAILILPWMDNRYDLLEQRLKGQPFYAYSREIRAALDGLFGERFNLKRMAKESITTLLVNLPVFEQHGRNENWPKWLRKKSYFRDCLRFYHLYKEAQDGTQVEAKEFEVKETILPDEEFNSPRQFTGKRGAKARKGGRPAFTNSKKGLFGLKSR